MDAGAFGRAWCGVGLSAFNRALRRGRNTSRARRVAVSAYAREMGKRGVWGGEAEIATAARLLGRRIEVYVDDLIGDPQVGCTYGDDAIKDPVRIVYDGVCHYDRLVSRDDGTLCSRPVPPDGDCLFTALSSGRPNDGHRLRRRVAADHAARSDDLMGFFPFPDVPLRRRPSVARRKKRRLRRRRRLR